MNEIGGRDAALLEAVLDTAGEIHRRLDAVVEEHGLSLPKLEMLAALVARGGSMPLGQLANALACVKSNVTQLVDRLEADGLVRRAADPEDRRSTLAVITDEGRQRCERASRDKAAAEQQLMAALPAASRKQLAALLDRLRQPAR